MQALFNDYTKAIQGLESYLPAVQAISFEVLSPQAFTSHADMTTALSSLFTEEQLTGWVTCQSNTYLVDSADQLKTIIDSEIVVNAELAFADISISVQTEAGGWHIYQTVAKKSDQPNALAVPRSYCVDTVRFTNGSNQQLQYWVIWQNKNNEMAPVAQHFCGLAEDKEVKR